MASLQALRNFHSQLQTDLHAARGMVSLVAGLREFYREPVTLTQAMADIRAEVDSREQSFLDLVQTQVYRHASSPYRKLLRWAGCEFSDLQTMVGQRGLEKTLESLAAAGVYLTSEEFKGRKEVVRTGGSFRVVAQDIRLRLNDRGLVLNQSSGTSGRAQRYAFSPARMAAASRLCCLLMEAHDLFDHRFAIFDAVMPSSGGIRHLLGFAKCGVAIDSWFARRVPITSLAEALFHRMTTAAIVMATKSFGPGGPWPEFLERDDVGRIVSWVGEQQKAGNPCCLRSTVSNAIKVVRSAEARAQSLNGATFVVSGEPLTEFKRGLIEKAGGRAVPWYGCAGLGAIGYGCGQPARNDDFHVPSHRLAVIDHPKALDFAGHVIRPFLFSTLSPLASSLHINVENGDFGVIEERDCGCAFHKAGLTRHLYQIGSFEKLTSEGMNYFFADLVPLLEMVLPSEFGGGPGDYQLMEEEDANGQTRLTLLVHPEVKQLDETKILARLRAAFTAGSRNSEYMVWVWQDAGTFRIKREIPYASPRGKILPLHFSQTRSKLGAHQR